MSDFENEPMAPSKQTSSVPLKKETIRVSLQGVDAPPAVPSATVSLAPRARPAANVSPTAGGAPVAMGGAPRPPTPAPTIALRRAGAPAMAPAPTIRLAAAAPTGLMKGAGPSPTIALPKATLQLATPTQPLGTSFSTSSQTASYQGEADEDEQVGEGIFKTLAILGFAAALVVLSLQLMTANNWVNAEDSPTKGDWMSLLS